MQLLQDFKAHCKYCNVGVLIEKYFHTTTLKYIKLKRRRQSTNIVGIVTNSSRWSRTKPNGTECVTKNVATLPAISVYIQVVKK